MQLAELEAAEKYIFARADAADVTQLLSAVNDGNVTRAISLWKLGGIFFTCDNTLKSQLSWAAINARSNNAAMFRELVKYHCVALTPYVVCNLQMQTWCTADLLHYVCQYMLHKHHKAHPTPSEQTALFHQQLAVVVLNNKRYADFKLFNKLQHFTKTVTCCTFHANRENQFS